MPSAYPNSPDGSNLETMLKYENYIYIGNFMDFMEKNLDAMAAEYKEKDNAELTKLFTCH